MSMLSRAAFVTSFALSACRAPAPGAPASPHSAVPGSSAPGTSRPPAATCESGAVPACDALAERWSSRDFVRGAASEEARSAAAALEKGCETHAVAAACLAYAIMRKSGAATGKPDADGAKAFFARLKGLRDLNGFRGDPATTPEGAAALTATASSCDAGRARACGQLGWAAYNAVQRDKSVKDAFVAYARACGLGSGNGCRWAGHFAATYPDETGAASRAEALLARGCDELENAGACDEHGALKAKRGDASGAEPRYARACDGGSRSGCVHLGEILFARGDTKANDVFKLACDAGDDAGCKRLPGASK